MPRPSIRLKDVRRLLRGAVEHEFSTGAVRRLKWFQYALGHGSNVSLTCRHFGISRSTFLRWAERFDPSDPRSLEEHSKRPKRVRAPETDARTIELIRVIRMREPYIGKGAVQEELKRVHGITLSTSTIGRIISRSAFFFGDTKGHRQKRAKQEDRRRGVDRSSGVPAPSNSDSTSDPGDTLSLFPTMGFTS